MRILIVALLISISTVFLYGQLTYNPSVEKGPKAMKIESISIDNSKTSIRIQHTAGLSSTWFIFSSQLYIYDYYNPSIKYQVVQFVGNTLDTKYTVQLGQVNHYELLFPKIPPGITKVSIQAFVPNGFLWDGITISNPDTSPKSTYTKELLKSDWIKNGIDEKEGIFEVIPVGQAIKYTVGIKKANNDYDIIYVDSDANSTWKEGDIKGYLKETGNSNVYKVKWYALNKAEFENVIASYSNGVWELMFSGTPTPMTLLKIFPTISDTDFSIPNSGKRTGTGFALHQSGLIATNYHVIENYTSIKIRGINGDFNSIYEAKVVILDKTNDLAVIKPIDIVNLGVIPYGLRNNIAEVGENIFVVGYPLLSTMGDEIKLTNGIISAKTGFMGDVTAYQVSAPVQPGNSGGPLFDTQGNLIGIINAKHFAADNASYGIKSNYLYNLIQSMDSPPALKWNNVISAKNLSQQVQAIKQFVYIIEVY